MAKKTGTRQELITTKLFAPIPATTLVSRPRLLQVLEEGLQGKLILLSAPAGFGKTTLLAEWIDTDVLPFCWLSLDPQDNTPSRFLSYLSGSLDSIGVQVEGSGSNPTLIQDAGETVYFLASLLRGVAENGREFCLVLDDYHLIQSDEIHDLVNNLLDNLPPAMHLVISTRSDPPLRLAQRRARCELCEIRAEDLRFTIEEAVQFFNQSMNINLSLEDVIRMEDKTEGWITGLQLAAISLAKHPDRKAFIDAFAGNDRYIADFLLEEALHGQPEEIQDFLMHTSILERMSVPLCNAVTGRKDSANLLEKLERANLFLVPLDNQRTWYRYHHLFSDLLYHHMQMFHPLNEPELHLKASRWYKKNNLLADAIRHAIAADDIERVVELTEAMAVFEMDEADLQVLKAWLDNQDNETYQKRPWLLVAQAWAFFNKGDYDSVENLLVTIQRDLKSSEHEPGLINRIHGHAAALRSYLAEVRDENDVALDLAEEALKCLPEEDVKLRAFVTIRKANCLSWIGDFEHAIPAYQKAGSLARQVGDGQMAITALSEGAVMQMMTGNLNRAVDSISEVDAYARTLTRKDGRRLPAMGILHRHMSHIFHEKNELAEAEAHARQAVEICTQWGEKESLLLAHYYLAIALFSQGRHQEADNEIQQAVKLGERISAVVAGSMVDASQYFSLLRGETAMVAEWAQELGLDPANSFAFDDRNVYHIYARFLLAKGQTEEALIVAGKLVQVVKAASALIFVIRYSVLKAIILQELSQEKEAMQAVKTALDLGSPEGYIRSFVDYGPAAARLLYQAAREGIQEEYCKKLLEQFPNKEMVKVTSAGREKLVDELSRRELEVLALIARGCSNQEIAAELVLSLYTIKSHARSIFSKMGVRNRTEAVARARLLGLLPQG